MNQNSESQSKDWKKVVIDIIIQVITLGLYHVEKHRSGSGPENPQS